MDYVEQIPSGNEPYQSDMPVAETLEQAKARYAYACHAMQTGVAYVMGRAPAETQPKHLRVGVNSAMCDNAALVGLLFKKGIITELEYVVALADEMEREVRRYEDRLNKEFKANVKLV